MITVILDFSFSKLNILGICRSVSIIRFCFVGFLVRKSCFLFLLVFFFILNTTCRPKIIVVDPHDALFLQG